MARLSGTTDFKFFMSKHLEKLRKKESKNGGDSENAFYLGGVFLGLFAVGAIGSFSPVSMMWGLTVGLSAGRGIYVLKGRRKSQQVTREVAVLYESVDMYMKEKYTLYDALLLSSMLVPGIRPAVNRCLMNWASGAKQAIKQMGDDIDNDASRMLSSMLIQICEEGYEGIKGVMSHEGQQLDELRASLAEAELAVKPVYQAVFLLLPGLGFLGMALMPWAYRMAQMIMSLHVGGGGEDLNNLPKIPFLRF